MSEPIHTELANHLVANIPRKPILIPDSRQYYFLWKYPWIRNAHLALTRLPAPDARVAIITKKMNREGY